MMSRLGSSLFFSLLSLSILLGNERVLAEDISLERWFCDQPNTSVKFSSEILNLNDSFCQKPPLPGNNGSVRVAGLSDAINLTKESPTVKSLDFSYYSTTLTSKAYYLKAFGPTFSLSNGALQASNSRSNSSYSYQQLNGSPSDASFSTSSSSYTQQLSLSPVLAVPLLNPQNINLARYYSKLSKSSAYSTTDEDLQQLTATLSNFVSLWIQKRVLQVSVDNLKASLEALDAAVGQYKVGLLAKPDLGSTLSTYRNYQASLLSAVSSYNSAYNSLANSMGIPPENLHMTSQALSGDALSPIVAYAVPAKSQLSSLVINNSSQIYAFVYQSQAYDRFADFYLSTYIPTFAIFASSSPSNSWNSFASSQSGTSQDQYQYNSSTSGSYSVGISFSWTLFDSFSAASLASSQKKLSLSNIQQARALAISKVQSAFTSLATYEALSLSTELLLNATRASLTAYNDTLYAIRAGFSDTTTLIQRLTQLNSNRLSYLSNLQSTLDSKINIAYLTRSGLFLDYNPYSLSYSLNISNIVK